MGGFLSNACRLGAGQVRGRYESATPYLQFSTMFLQDNYRQSPGSKDEDYIQDQPRGLAEEDDQKIRLSKILLYLEEQCCSEVS